MAGVVLATNLLFDWVAPGSPLQGGAEARRRTFAWIVILSLAGIAAIWLFAPLLMRLLHRRGLASLIAPPRAPLTRHILSGALLTLAATPFLMTLDALLTVDGARLVYVGPFAGWAVLALLAGLLIPLQAAGEELLFRGYLQQQLAARCPSPVIWAVLPSIGFGWLHQDPSLGADLSRAFIASTALFGLGAAYLTWRTGSLGIAIGAHVMNNWIALLALGLAEDSLSALALWRVEGVAPIDLVLFAAAEMLLFALVIETGPVRRWLRLPPWSLRTLAPQPISQ